MIIIEDLLKWDEKWRKNTAKFPFDPLREKDALWETQLLDVRFDVLHSIAALLLEMRTAEQLGEIADVGVLVAYGVRGISWEISSPLDHPLAGPPIYLRAWTIFDGHPCNTDGLFSLEFGTWPNAEFKLEAESAGFFAGNIPNLGDIPNYDSDEETIRAHIANWHSEFEIRQMSFLDPTVGEC